jgi:hypothetical protein
MVDVGLNGQNLHARTNTNVTMDAISTHHVNFDNLDYTTSQ